MISRPACGLAVALFLAAAASAQTGDSPPAGSLDESGADQSTTTTTTDVTTSNPSAVVLSNDEYVKQAAAGDLFEIESSKLALETSQNTDVLAFAQMMIDDHTRMAAALKEAVVGSGLDIPIPTAPGGDEEQKLNALRAAGNDFDRQYVGMQLQGHEQALALHEGYAEAGENAELRAVATTAVPVVTGHLEEIRRIAEPFMSTQQ
jgi:putative membrane protein